MCAHAAAAGREKPWFLCPKMARKTRVEMIIFKN
jgi:hypothetical protein